MIKNIIYYSIGLVSLYLINVLNNFDFNYFLLISFYLVINTILLESYFGKFIFLLKICTLYLIFIIRYININIIKQDNIFNILYLINLLTLINKINKLGIIRLNLLNYTEIYKLILSSYIFLTLIFQYLFYTEINDLIYLLPLMLSHLFLYFKIKELWIISYVLSIFLLNVT
jgi:hypothetical protein